MVWWNLVYALVMMVISYAISFAMMPKSTMSDATVGAMDVPTAEAGKTVPVIFGTILVKDSNVIDYFDAKTVAIESGGGGKK